MPRTVVFDTPGWLDLRAITILGVNAKPNSENPIGHFGTGLKYSVAVLVREAIPVSLMTEGKSYAFYKKSTKFREKDFEVVRMKQHLLNPPIGKTTYTELPYTTEFGKNWELWMVFRELYSNTIDEGGKTYVVNDLSEIDLRHERTYIVVTSDEFAKEYDNRHQNFLPDGLTVKQEDTKLQVLDRPSNHVYYRGMRVMDLKKPSLFTYNFLEGVELTEDRTAKNTWWVNNMVERYILESSDSNLVERAVNAPEDSWESGLSYTYHSVEPTETFTKAVTARATANPTAAAFVRKQAVKGAMRHPLAKRPRPWRVQGDYIVDRDDDPVLKWRFDGGLESSELVYAVMLLQKNLEEWELEQYLDEKDGVVQPQRELDDVPF